MMQAPATQQDQAQRSLDIAFITGSLYNESSGPYATLRDTVTALHDQGHRPHVFGTRGARQGPAPPAWPGNLHALSQVGPFSLHWSPGLASLLRNADRADVVALESLWLYNHATAARWADRHRIPYIITPHGNLNEHALSIRGKKKQLALRLFAKDVLDGARCFHATSLPEANAIRRARPEQPVFHIPNGVTIPDAASATRSALPAAYTKQVQGRRIVLYLGRLHPIKGLDRLVRAWQQMSRRHPDCVLALVGPDDGQEAELRRLVRDLSLHDSVLIPGPAHGALKSSWYHAASLFILPSTSEGFAIAPLEALAHGLPVVLTDACNFAEAAQAGAGMQCTPETHSLASALDHMLERNEDTLRLMGDHGRRLVKAKYGWDAIASQLVEVYGWMTNDRPLPQTCLNPEAARR